jgi:hypothetical protein
LNRKNTEQIELLEPRCCRDPCGRIFDGSVPSRGIAGEVAEAIELARTRIQSREQENILALPARWRVQCEGKLIGQPEDVADAIVFVASDRARWINGAIIPVDGGSKLQIPPRVFSFALSATGKLTISSRNAAPDRDADRMLWNKSRATQFREAESCEFIQVERSTCDLRRFHCHVCHWFLSAVRTTTLPNLQCSLPHRLPWPPLRFSR